MNENQDTITTPTPEASASSVIRSDKSIRAVIDVAVSRGQITVDQGEQIYWLHGHALDNNFQLPQLSKRTGISKAALSQLFSGKYPAEDWTQIVSRIIKYRQESDNLIKSTDVGCIETTTAKLIFKLCKQALYDNMPAYIYGASQLGKTKSLEEFVRRCIHCCIPLSYLGVVVVCKASFAATSASSEYPLCNRDPHLVCYGFAVWLLYHRSACYQLFG